MRDELIRWQNIMEAIENSELERRKVGGNW